MWVLAPLIHSFRVLLLLWSRFLWFFVIILMLAIQTFISNCFFFSTANILLHHLFPWLFNFSNVFSGCQGALSCFKTLLYASIIAGVLLGSTLDCCRRRFGLTKNPSEWVSLWFPGLKFQLSWYSKKKAPEAGKCPSFKNSSPHLGGVPEHVVLKMKVSVPGTLSVKLLEVRKNWNNCKEWNTCVPLKVLVIYVGGWSCTVQVWISHNSKWKRPL